ncbi:hypothetical protein Patl1_14401 [Pistacia atlantica]|uniref:Uncharacterized protein n=1 Tax=Pistacia atlantica TaxID=434234 RepID=A0ACC1AVL6_9ROSI|nr:hypothetical protein Patl1_14401 [Pistacia atlantica]
MEAFSKAAKLVEGRKLGGFAINNFFKILKLIVYTVWYYHLKKSHPRGPSMSTQGLGSIFVAGCWVWQSRAESQKKMENKNEKKDLEIIDYKIETCDQEIESLRPERVQAEP